MIVAIDKLNKRAYTQYKFCSLSSPKNQTLENSGMQESSKMSFSMELI